MLIQKIQGGLGNQMFQYAFIKALALRHNTNFKIDISEYTPSYYRPYELDIFNIEKEYTINDEIPIYERFKIKNNNYLKYLIKTVLTFLGKRANKKHFIEKGNYFNKDLMYAKDGYFEGYFQSEKYFEDFKSEIRNDFTFIKSTQKRNSDFLLSLKGYNTVGVHIRRGDYLKLPTTHPPLSIEYYIDSIKYISCKIQNPIFLILSDDSERTHKYFTGKNYYIIDWNKDKNSWEDMYIMSQCKHNIIANSSFSRWGARLNNNPQKIVVCPKKLTKVFNEHYYPDDYYRINNL